MGIFKEKPYLEKEAGGFRFKFYYKEDNLAKTYLSITTASNVWGMTIAGNTYSYGFLLAAAKQGLSEQLGGFATYNYLIATQITQDRGLVGGLTRILDKWFKRVEKKAETAAKSVSDAEGQANQAFMEEVAAYADAKPKERKKMRKESKARMREALNEENSEE